MSASPIILVVDDNRANRQVLAKALETSGYEVLTAKDGFEAVETATRNRPALILLDVMMPGRNGLETCTVLKAREETAAIPVIFVTAVSETGEIVKAFACGGCDYVIKPFRLAEVLARVSVHVRLHQAEEELRLKNCRMQELTAKLSEANVELANLSRVDPLTKLLNRRTWEEAVGREQERFERHGHSYSIVMLDVDHFKAFNDSQGHQAGDKCLRRLADAIRTSCRRVDVVGRYGGEEFVVLAPDTGAEAAIKLAERVRKAVWGLGIPHPRSKTAGRVTISLGVAASGPDSWETVLKRADDALYVAKRAGRNMVYGDDPSVPAIPERPAADGSAGSDRPGKDTDDHNVSVLVVDDEPTSRVLSRGILERAGYRVREAVDGHAAVTCVNEDPPDVIIMDALMPNMDGLECTRILKANPDTCDIPVIMVSALAAGEDILAGLEAGADEYLIKPIRANELTLRVRSMARQYRDRRDLLGSLQLRGEHMRILGRLVEFCRAVGSSRRLNEVLDHTIAAIADVVRCRRISIMLPDHDEKRLSISKSSGMDAELAATVKVPIGEAIAGQVFASGRPIVINSDAEKQASPKAYDCRFFASVPLISTPLGTSDRVLGVLNVTDRAGRKPFEPHELEYIELIAKVAATALHGIFTRQAHEQASDSIMVALAKLAEHRDNDTGMHLDRVTRYCGILAEQLRTTDEFRDQIDDAFMHDLVRAVPLHDIGKVAIPDRILLHPGELTSEQMTVMRTHAAVGARTIQSLIERAPGVDFLMMAADIAHYHHEWYDGSGYPLGLKGGAIPLSARLTAVADVYDAMTTKRVYKAPISHDKAAAVLADASGTQFDPAIIDAFLKRESEFANLARTMADEPPRELIHAGVRAE